MVAGFGLDLGVNPCAIVKLNELQWPSEIASVARLLSATRKGRGTFLQTFSAKALNPKALKPKP